MLDSYKAADDSPDSIQKILQVEKEKFEAEQKAAVPIAPPVPIARKSIIKASKTDQTGSKNGSKMDQNGSKNRSKSGENGSKSSQNESQNGSSNESKKSSAKRHWAFIKHLAKFTCIFRKMSDAESRSLICAEIEKLNRVVQEFDEGRGLSVFTFFPLF